MKLDPTPFSADINYIIVSERDKNSFESVVRSMLKKGFSIRGNPFYAQGEFHQAMTKTEPKEPKKKHKNK